MNVPREATTMRVIVPAQRAHASPFRRYTARAVKYPPLAASGWSQSRIVEPPSFMLRLRTNRSDLQRIFISAAFKRSARRFG